MKKQQVMKKKYLGFYINEDGDLIQVYTNTPAIQLQQESGYVSVNILGGKQGDLEREVLRTYVLSAPVKKLPKL